MASFQITIVGLGAMGKSLGLALKAVSKELRVVGHDRESEAAAAARKARAVDRTDWNLPAACQGAGLVILALPLSAIHDTLAAIGPELSAGCLVMDTARVKVPVLAWAKEALPPQVHFVGGDPIGARRQATASADLFANTTFCLCTAPDAPREAIERAADLVATVGANPRFLDAVEHDGLVAAVDALPFLLSAAALQAANSSPAWRELVGLGGGRFEQLLAALGDNPGAELEVALANAANIGRWLDSVQAALDSLRALLAAEPEARERATQLLLEARASWERHDSEPSHAQPDYQPFGLRHLLGFR